MPALRWSIAAVLLVGTAALVAPRLWSGTGDRLGTESPVATARFLEGRDQLRRLEVESACSSLAASIDADPAFAMARFEYGHALVWAGDRKGGLAQIRRADSLAHESGLTTDLERLVIGLAASRLDEDQARQAELYRELVAEYPHHPESLRIQAQHALDQGDPSRARQLFREVLRADPDRVEIHNTLGYLALRQGRYEDAVASFKRYAYFAADAANPHDSLGEAYLWTGRYHESIEQYQEALRIDPSFVSSVVGASEALAVTGQFRLARKLLDNFTELFSRRGQEATRELRALQIDYLAEDWAQVVERARKLREQPGLADAETGIRLWADTFAAVSLAELGRREESAELASAVDGQLDALLARIDVDDLESREELQLLRASLHCRLAVLAGRPATHELAELRGLIEASTRQPHRLLPYQGVLVESLYEAGLDAEALAFAPRVLAFNPHHPRTLLVGAEAAARLRDRDTALDFLRRYLDVMQEADDSHPRVMRARQLLDQLAPSS